MNNSATKNQKANSSARQRTPLVSGGFDRVSKKRPCRICNRTTYCGFSRDGRTSICMRVSQGSRGPSRNGGNIHVHSEIPHTNIHQPTPSVSTPTIPIAPLVIRNAVFKELIRLSPASQYRTELVTGEGGLYSRGLLDKHAQAFGALPPTKQERAALAATLQRFVKDNFDSYGKLYSGAGVVGIPGFWQDPSGMVHIWKPRNYLMPILVIPYKDADGLIQACQIRLHPKDIPPGEKKYRWLASPMDRRGTSSGTPIHFTFAPTRYSAGQPVLITEGALKAETFVHFRPNARVIATSGVSCSHNEIIEAARPYNAFIAFDSDHRTNVAVCRQLARLIAQRTTDAVIHKLTTTTRIVFWNGPKGIDEAVQAKVPLCSLTTSEWFAALENEPLYEVQRFWTEIGFKP